MKNPPSSNQPSKAPGAQTGIIERLFADKTWIQNYRITTEEKIVLSNAAMMGEISSERDVLFILNQIRRARLRW
jgi:hypothetical protein